MRNQISVTGMVLQAGPVGEYDRRLVILTKERGKISVFARGARRPNSPLMGVSSPFSFGTFALYEGRTSYSLMSASVSNYFAGLRTDVEGAYYGFYFMDLAGYYAREACDESQMLKLLYQTLRALENEHIPNRLVRRIYELRTITVNGEGPQVFECVACGAKEEGMAFSVKRGGLLCKKCQEALKEGRKLFPSTTYTLQYVISSPIEKLYNFIVKDEVLEEFEDLMDGYLHAYVNKSFKSLEILETIAD